MNRRRVVITGLGTVNPLASNVPDYWAALLAGKSGIGRIEQFDTSAFKVHFGGEIKQFDVVPIVDARAARRVDRFAQFALIAADEAVKDSGLDLSREDAYRCGVAIGSGIGGLNEFEEQFTRWMDGGPRKISPFVIPKMMPNAAAGHVSIVYGLAGPNTATATACASAANAIADAARAIQFGYAEVMVAGGAESVITPMGLGGFVSAQALSMREHEPQAASRPFDRDRDGFVLSEGAGLLVLEELEHARRRDARIYAEFLGSGSTADAYHLTAPHEDGRGAARAIGNCLADSGLAATDVDYINAHGTSTPLGDAAETRAIKTALGEHARRVAISSTKSMTGHLLGASGGIELIACVLSIRHGVVHPTINYHTPDPACDLDYVPNQHREMRVRVALSNSFGFGGHNCCVAVRAV